MASDSACAPLMCAQDLHGDADVKAWTSKYAGRRDIVTEATEGAVAACASAGRYCDDAAVDTGSGSGSGSTSDSGSGSGSDSGVGSVAGSVAGAIADMKSTLSGATPYRRLERAAGITIDAGAVANDAAAAAANATASTTAQLLAAATATAARFDALSAAVVSAPTAAASKTSKAPAELPLALAKKLGPAAAAAAVACIRKVENWSTLLPRHRFDSPSFDPVAVRKELPLVSPKLVALIDTIQGIDAGHVERGEPLGKHLIFSDLRADGFGAKAIASALMAHGYVNGLCAPGSTKPMPGLLAYNDKVSKRVASAGVSAAIPLNLPPAPAANTFLLLSSTALWDTPFNPAVARLVLRVYNERPANVYGAKARFLVLDSGFREGVDAFDVQYVHLFEPLLTEADATQATGRATRVCGQKGLRFIPGVGHPLEVRQYYTAVPSALLRGWGITRLFDVVARLRSLSGDARDDALTRAIDAVTRLGAVDEPLTAALHADTRPGAGRVVIESVDNPIVIDSRDTTAGNDGSGDDARVVLSEDVVPAPPVARNVIRDDDATASPRRASSRRDDGLAQDASRDAVVSTADADADAGADADANADAAAASNAASIAAERSACAAVCADASPAALHALVEAWLSLGRPSPPTLQLRTFLCAAMAKDAAFCFAARRAYAEVVMPAGHGVPSGATVEALLQPFTFTTAHALVVRSPFTRARGKRFGWLDLRALVKTRFGAFAWPPPRPVDGCVTTSLQTPVGPARIATYNLSQAFISEYFRPSNPLKGMLLWWTVGTGKTCGAIAVASRQFEVAGYRVLWVTRASLLSDLWKNLLDGFVCHAGIADDLRSGAFPDTPEGRAKRRADLLRTSWHDPISYRTFTNLFDSHTTENNPLRKKLRELNGAADPLRKTLLVIDEAHKLVGDDFKAGEVPDFDVLAKAIHTSYAKSGSDSVRVLLLTGTPYNASALEMMKLLNLLRPPAEALPTTAAAFRARFCGGRKDADAFTPAGLEDYLNAIAGYVSYLDRRNDPSQFATPRYTLVPVPLSTVAPDPGAVDALRAALSAVDAEADALADAVLPALRSELAGLPAALEQRKRACGADSDSGSDSGSSTPVTLCVERQEQWFAAQKADLSETIATTEKRLAALYANGDALQARIDAAEAAAKGGMATDLARMSQEYQLRSKCGGLFGKRPSLRRSGAQPSRRRHTAAAAAAAPLVDTRVEPSEQGGR